MDEQEDPSKSAFMFRQQPHVMSDESVHLPIVLRRLQSCRLIVIIIIRMTSQSSDTDDIFLCNFNIILGKMEAMVLHLSIFL